MLRIFTGRESVDTEKFIFSHIAEEGRGARALVIVPDQYTLEAERRLFYETGAKALMDTEIVSLSRLGHRILRELGGEKRTFIDKYGRHMILDSIMREKREMLQVFRGMEGKSSFLEMLNNFISEMKQFNAGEAELTEIISKTEEGSYTEKKLSDIRLLYIEYEKRIEGKYTDSEDYIDLFLSKIKDSELIKGNTVWVYGFDSFAPKALSVIGELTAYAGEVNVCLTYSDEEGERDGEIFALTGIVKDNLVRQAETRGISCEIHKIPEKFIEKKPSRAIEHLEKELYAIPAFPFEEEAGEITLVEAANLYSEAEDAASYVLSLVRDEGYRYRDIKVICNDSETLAPIMRRIFREYGIELFSDDERSVESSPIVRYIISMLEAVMSGYLRSCIIGMVKSGMSDLTADEIMDIENYAVKYRVNGSTWKKPFTKGSFEYEPEEIERLNDIRERITAPLERFKTLFDAKKMSEFIEALYDFLQNEGHIPEKIEALAKSQLEAGREDLAEETDQIWKAVVRIIDQIYEITSGKDFDAKAFLSYFKKGISEIKIGVLPPTSDSLIMGNMQRTRPGNVKALVAVGANEGVIPKGISPAGFFGEEEKNMFKEQGVELCKLDSVMLSEEKLGIYRILTSPKEKLYVSFSSGDAEGKSAKPSPVFMKLKEIFPKVKARRDIVSGNDYSMLLNGETAGLRHITESLRKTSEGESMPDEMLKGLSWLKREKSEALAAIYSGIANQNEAEPLGNIQAAKLYPRTETAELRLSPSGIEKYSRCPFSYYIGYGLKPDERRIFEVSSREIGDIYHSSIMEITSRLTPKEGALTAHSSMWMTITDDELRDMIAEIIEKESANYRDGLFKSGSEENYRAERIKSACFNAAKALIDQVRAGSILSSCFEEAFGRGRIIPAIEIMTDSGKAYIEGKIDRVDFLKDDRVKIIDYKTGNETFSIKEAREGYRLQLMLYLCAAKGEKGKPAGVFYFRIYEPVIEVSEAKVDKEMLREALKKEFKLNGIIVDEPEVIRAVAGEFEKTSDILNIRMTEDGVKSSGRTEETVISEEAFNELENAVLEKVREAAISLANGEIDIHPMKTKTRSACTYCSYKGICRFDTVFEGNSYNIIR